MDRWIRNDGRLLTKLFSRCHRQWRNNILCESPVLCSMLCRCTIRYKILLSILNKGKEENVQWHNLLMIIKLKINLFLLIVSKNWWKYTPNGLHTSIIALWNSCSYKNCYLIIYSNRQGTIKTYVNLWQSWNVFFL